MVQVEERDSGAINVIILSGGFLPERMYDLQYDKSTSVHYHDGG